MDTTDVYFSGPHLSVAGVPVAGFKPDGSWTPLTVKVDNSANLAVANYTPRITLSPRSHDTGKLKADWVKVERLVTDPAGNRSWQPADFIGGATAGVLVYELGTMASVAQESVYTIDVRISFTPDTALIPFELSARGVKPRNGYAGYAWSLTAYYNTGIAGASGFGPRQDEGARLSLAGVPAEGIKAGGDWQEIGFRVDNTGKEAWKDHTLQLLVRDSVFGSMSDLSADVEVEEYDGNGWQRAKSYTVVGTHYGLKNRDIAAGEIFEIKLRIRFTKDARPGYVSLIPEGGRDVWPEPDANGDLRFVTSLGEGRLTKILPADVDTGNQPKPDDGTGNQPKPKPDGGTGTGNQPKPDGNTGTTPISITGTSTTGTGNTTHTGGALAATGVDPATTWALGGAGVALAMGAALVAGTGRHRRRTNA